jgi:hypothetical protein
MRRAGRRVYAFRDSLATRGGLIRVVSAAAVVIARIAVTVSLVLASAAGARGQALPPVIMPPAIMPG